MEPQSLPGFERPAAPRRDVPRPEGRIVRVQPDITSVTGAFDYHVPVAWEEDGRSERVAIGSLVRIDFSGRRTAGWVVDVDVEPTPDVEIRALRRWSSVGPPEEVIELARWAAWRWNGRLPHFLRAASPPRMVPSVRPRTSERPRPVAPRASAFEGPLTLVRTTPADTGIDLAVSAAALGSALILVPTIARRRALARALTQAGVAVAEYNDQWERAAGGAVTVGTRLTAWAPTPDLAAILVLDEHDPAYKEERTPSWNARDVAIERAARRNIPCVLASASPSLESLERADRRLVPERSTEREGWPQLQVVDLRSKENPGLLTPEIVDLIRGEGPIACVLNRKGRARMLACGTCASLASCAECAAAVAQPTDDAHLVCSRCGTKRPVVCTECGATRMKLIRPGISRIAEELRALAKRDVTEITAETPDRDLAGDRLLIGTEALLHRLERASSVIFLDFDQELAVPRYRAAEDAFALLAFAARLVGPRADGGRVVVQTRRPDDVVLQAALHGDPDRMSRAQRDIRTVFAQPPYGAWALVSGAGAEHYVGDLPDTVRVLRNEDRWRVAAPDHTTLLDALAATPRPAERLRVEVDPLDA